MQLALFIIFGLLAVGAAVNLLLQRHPINSALSLVVVMMSLAVLYWSLGAEFLAAAQVIVYAGAIMVLFTFVVMLLNAGEEERTHGSKIAYIAGFPGAAAIFCLLSFVFLSERRQLGVDQHRWRPWRPCFQSPSAFALCSSRLSCCRSRSPAS